MKNTNKCNVGDNGLLLSTALLLPACSNGGSDSKPYYKGGFTDGHLLQR